MIADARFAERPAVAGRERRRRGAAWKSSQLMSTPAAPTTAAPVDIATGAPVMAAAAPAWPSPLKMPRLLRTLDAAGQVAVTSGDPERQIRAGRDQPGAG